MKPTLSTLAALLFFLAASNTTADPGKTIYALEGEVYHVGETGLRILFPKWNDPKANRLRSETSEHYVKIATKGAGFYEGQRVAVYVHEGGTVEWEGRTLKRWDAVPASSLPKGFRLSFPSEYGSR